LNGDLHDLVAVIQQKLSRKFGSGYSSPSCQVLDEKPGINRTLGNQLLRAGTSIGANVAEGQGSQSEADFLTKYSIAVKEARETDYWLDLIIKAELLPQKKLTDIKQECSELIAILTTICKKLKDKRK
jgi:four helix bundle protein